MRDLSGVPYIGSRISLISKSEIRYEGILFSIDTKESTVALQNVRSFGTEGRKEEGAIPASNEVYDYIIFRGADIKDIHVREAPTQPPSNRPVDPAIIAMPSAPIPQGGAPPQGNVPQPSTPPPTTAQTQGAATSTSSTSTSTPTTTTPTPTPAPTTAPTPTPGGPAPAPSSTPNQPAPPPPQGQNPPPGHPMYNAYPPHYPYPYNPLGYYPYYNNNGPYPPPGPYNPQHPGAGPQTIPPHPHTHAPHLHHPHAHPHPHHPPSHHPSLVHPQGVPAQSAPNQPASDPAHPSPSNPAAPNAAPAPTAPHTESTPATSTPPSNAATPSTVSPPTAAPSTVSPPHINSPTPAAPQSQPQNASPQTGKSQPPKDNRQQDRPNQRNQNQNQNQNQKRYEPVDRRRNQNDLSGDIGQLNINAPVPTHQPFQRHHPVHNQGQVGYVPKGPNNHHHGGGGARRGRGPQQGGLIPFPGQHLHQHPPMQQIPPTIQQHQKKQPQEEFNFELANSRFSKEKLIEEVSHTPETKTDLPPPAPAPGISSVYSKTSSFFDNLSCETLERNATKQEERKTMNKQTSQDQRRLDAETFGASSTRSHHAHSHRGGRRYHSNRGGGHSGPRPQQQQKDNKAEISVRT